MPASYQQGYDAQAKQSTRYLANGANVAACITDRSQRMLNMTAGTNSAYENNTVRFNYSHPRTILVRGTVDNNDTGDIFRHGTGGNLELLYFSSANTIRVRVANADVLTYSVTGLPAPAGADGLVIAWVSQANPDTTGASDAVLSWLMIWNTTDGTFDKVAFTHVTKALQASTPGVWGAADSAGINAFTGTITDVLYENRAMSATEIANDWVTALTPPSSSVEPELQGLPPQSATIDAQNFHHGPAAIWAGDATRRMIRRTLQPLRNLCFRIQGAWDAAALAATDPFIRAAPGVSADRMHLAWLECAPVPDNCNRMWVRVQIRSRTSSGAAVPVRVRVWSFSRPPGVLTLVGDPGNGDPLESYFVGATITRDDDASAGEYTVLGSMPIARGTSGVDEGMTYIAMSLAVDPAGASANDAAALIYVKSIHCVPYYLEGGLPLPVHP